MGFSREIKVLDEDLEKILFFEGLRSRMLELPEEDLKKQIQKLSILRLSSSQSNITKDSATLERWNKAQRCLFENSTSLIDYEFIKKINEILTGKNIVERTQDIYGGGAAFLSNTEKNKELMHFQNEILPNLHKLHPIVASTALRYWLVSLHPFVDGNGRTSQSVADARLFKASFPPLYFKNSYQGSFAYISIHREDFNFRSALQISFIGLSNAFQVILSD